MSVDIRLNEKVLSGLGLNPMQTEAVRYFGGPLLILAGAGSGKTRTLTSKIAVLIASGIHPSRILAITFTNKAAREMANRVARTAPGSAGIWIHTFHGLGARILRQHGHHVGVKKNFTIYDEAEQKRAILLALKSLNLESEKKKADYYLACISKAKDELLDAKSYLINSEVSGNENRMKIARIYLRYQRELEIAGALDFGDLIVKTCELFNHSESVRNYFQNLFQYVLVDEYQDTNHAQYVLIKTLSARHRNLCVVGDPDQCLPSDTQIMTDKGPVVIKDLKTKNKVVSASGLNRTMAAEPSKISKKFFKGNLVEIRTESKKTLACTPNHMCFARLEPTKNLHYVYLMKRNNMGFRIGVTFGNRTSKDGKTPSGLMVRTNQEVADAIWILKACPSDQEARYFEQFYSLKYGLPTAVFHARGRKLPLSQKLINRLYKQIDTAAAAEKLMEDLCLNPDFPHHRPFPVTRKGFSRKSVWFTVFGDTREKISEKTHYHRIQLATSGNALRKKVERIFPVRAGNKGAWRIEITKKDYDEALNLAKKISRLNDMDIISRGKITKGNPFYFMPASHLCEGMKIPVLKNGKIVEDEISSVKSHFYKGYVYDISAPSSRNFAANNIIVHNSIYSWRGADIRNIMEFEKDFRDAKTIILEQNYRSTPNILETANKVIENNARRKPKNLWTENGEGEKVSLISCDNETDEAEKILKKINSLRETGGYSCDDIAIFYRTNAQSRSFEETFLRSRLPYRLVGSVKFYERKEVKDALAYVKILINPHDNASLLRVLNTPPRGIGKTAVGRIFRFSEENETSVFRSLESVGRMESLSASAAKGIREFLLLREMLTRDIRKDPPHVLIEKVLSKTGYWQWTEEMADKDPEASFARLGNLQELVNAVKEFEEKRERAGLEAGISQFLEDIALASNLDGMDNSREAVTLMTVHLAKGLEFPVIFLTGLEEGLFPINTANMSEGEMEEERRLCYVGMTRAKRKLFLSWARTRKTFGKTFVNTKSRFVFEAGLAKKSEAPAAGASLNPMQRTQPGLAGKKVSHPVYGIGKVLNVVGSGEYAKITVMFFNGSKQTFMLKYAPLKIL